MTYSRGLDGARRSAAACTPGRGGFAKFMDNGENLSRRLERRWAPRYSFRADLEIEWGSAVLAGKTRDISSNGMFIEAADTLWIGAGFMARLNVDPPVKVDCSVKRVEPGLGMGVSVALSESDQQKYYQDLLVSLAGNPTSTAL
jgi:PilZ domain-containing protein